MDGRTVERLARLEQQRVAARSDTRRVEAEHGARLKPAAGQRVRCHEHSPIQRSELVCSARAALLVVLREREAVGHEVPGPGVEAGRRNGDRVWYPRGT